MIEEMQQMLAEKLAERGVGDHRIAQVLDSGYFFTRLGSGFDGRWIDGVKDSYYGSKPAGLFALEEFVSFLGGHPPSRRPSIIVEHTVASLADAQRILANERHARFRAKMSFRGQPCEHTLQRRVPNPQAAMADGMERMILPKWWRPFKGTNPATWRYSRGSIFTQGILAEPVIFSDMPDWAEYAHRHRLELTDYLEEFPDEKCREIYRRYNRHFIEGPFGKEMPLLELSSDIRNWPLGDMRN
jgi:hypothetical protein